LLADPPSNETIDVFYIKKILTFSSGWLKNAYLLTYLLTPHSTVLLEKLTGSQTVKKFPAFYGTRRFITAFTSANHLPYPEPARSNPMMWLWTGLNVFIQPFMSVGQPCLFFKIYSVVVPRYLDLADLVCGCAIIICSYGFSLWLCHDILILRI